MSFFKKLRRANKKVMSKYGRAGKTNGNKLLRKHLELSKKGFIRPSESLPVSKPVRNLNRRRFIKWIKRVNPSLYSKAIQRMPPQINQLNGLGDTESSWLDSLTGTIQNLIPQYYQVRQQRELMKMQMERARAGLPPANVADYTPVIKTQVGIEPETRRELIRESSSVMKPLLYGSLGLLGAALFLRGKRR